MAETSHAVLPPTAAEPAVPGARVTVAAQPQQAEPTIQVTAATPAAPQTVGTLPQVLEIRQPSRLPVPETQPHLVGELEARAGTELDIPEPQRPMRDYMIVFASQPGIVVTERIKTGFC